MSESKVTPNVPLWMMNDEAALLMLQEYSKACARFAHEPSQANALAMDTRRDAMQTHFAQREHAIGCAIDRLVGAAKQAGSTMVTATDAMLNQDNMRLREAELRTIIGLS